MLQAMNTGHEGSLATIHANDTRDALARLEMMVTMAGFEMPLPVIRNYVASAIRVVIHLARLQGGARKIMRISEIVGMNKRGQYRVRDVFGFRQLGVKNDRAVGEFYATGHVPKCVARFRSAGIDFAPGIFTAGVLPTAAGSEDEDAPDVVDSAGSATKG
jgi:pilus assembly protein CpaF